VLNGGLDIIIRTILDTPCNQHPSKKPWILTICFSGVYEHDFQIYWFYHHAYVGICEDVARPIQIEEPPVSFQAMMNIKIFDCTLDRMELTSLEGNPWTIICITHGRFSRVFLAPCASSPLCCLQNWVNSICGIIKKKFNVPYSSRGRRCASYIYSRGSGLRKILRYAQLRTLTMLHEVSELISVGSMHRKGGTNGKIMRI